MFSYSIVFFAIALVAALFAFGGLAAEVAFIAKTLFYIFLPLFVLSFLFGALASKKKAQDENKLT